LSVPSPFSQNPRLYRSSFSAPHIPFPLLPKYVVLLLML